MKILLVVFGLLAAAAAGAAGGALFAPAAPAPAPVTAAPEPAQVAAAAPAMPAAAQEQIDRLTREVGHLQLELAELRAAANRSPAQGAPVAEVAAAAPVQPASTVTAAQREMVLQVIADQKAAEQRAAEEERKRREEEQRLQRADRMAQRFGLNESQERQLADFYNLERQRFDEAREKFRDAREFGNVDPEQMRTAMRDARDWRTNELVRMFGEETGKQLAEFESDRGGRGGDFFEGGGQRRARPAQAQGGNQGNPGGGAGGG